LNSGGYFVNLLPFLAMRKEPPYKNSIVLFILSIIRGSFQDNSPISYIKNEQNQFSDNQNLGLFAFFVQL
ncbi:hypothetical protein, partial [Streptococcus ruminantium]|uniref:hypothetical protein n=1 Tax=Streptococcus ruminantium TaxID=1917441 RepID=UPI00280DB3B4